MKLKKKGKDFSGKISVWVKERREKRAERSIVGMPVIRVGPNRKMVFVLWAVLLSSLAFAVYKNFTAVDREIIREREVVEERVKDTNRAEGFVRQFAESFYSWGYDTASKDERAAAASLYLTDELVMLNSGTISSECPTASEVLAVNIWGTEETENGRYRVTYSVRQKLTEAADLTPEPGTGAEGPLQETGGEDADGETVSAVKDRETVRESFYMTEVVMEDDGSMVIVKNPTAASTPERHHTGRPKRKATGQSAPRNRKKSKVFLTRFSPCTRLQRKRTGILCGYGCAWDHRPGSGI